jgi:hypothetical protein
MRGSCVPLGPHPVARIEDYRKNVLVVTFSYSHFLVPFLADSLGLAGGSAFSYFNNLFSTSNRRLSCFCGACSLEFFMSCVKAWR